MASTDKAEIDTEYPYKEACLLQLSDKKYGWSKMKYDDMPFFKSKIREYLLLHIWVFLKFTSKDFVGKDFVWSLSESHWFDGFWVVYEHFAYF